jgi:hypothetical protein
MHMNLVGNLYKFIARHSSRVPVLKGLAFNDLLDLVLIIDLIGNPDKFVATHSSRAPVLKGLLLYDLI